MISMAAPSMGRIADRHVRLEALLAIVLCAFVVKSVTPALLGHAAVIAVMFVILTVPLGSVAARVVLPADAPVHVRWGLTLGLGYALAAPILIVTSRFGVAGLFAPPLLALAVFAGHRLRAGRGPGADAPARSLLFDTGRTWTSESTFVVLVIASFSLACVTPLMNPLRHVTSTMFVNYAYIDSFFHLNLVQRLMTSAPLQDWPNVAGSAPIFYQDFHHLLVATLARLGRVPASDMFFFYAPMIVVPVTVVLAYAVGTSLTGSRVGGFISAALQYIVLVPNVYDRNIFLQDRWTIVLPNFYQIHFYDLRYAQHAASGWILVLAMVLCWIVALRSADDRRTAMRATLASCFLLAVLFRFRPQFALMMALPSAMLVLWLARKQPLVLIGAAVVGALSLGWVLYPFNTLQSNSSGLVVKYGVFATRVSRAGYYLPNAVTSVLGFLPAGPREFVGLALVVGMRIIGLNLLILMLIGARTLWRTRQGSLFARPETYLWGAVAGGFLAALLLEQSAMEANIGWNILQGIVAPALLLATAGIVSGVGVSRLESWWDRNRKLSFALTVVFSLIAFRGAEALMHERPDRAYPLTTRELEAYEWVHENAPATAVVASDPRHRVNALGETIGTTSFLSGMTERSVYFQYVSPLTREEGLRRVPLLTAIYDARSEADACRLIRETGAHYWLEYSDRPFAVQPATCLERVFQGDPNVYRAVDR
jgi:hypothetical protein